MACRGIYQYHFEAWPHRGVPRDPGAVVKLVQDVSLQQSTLVIDAAIVVHSSEGIGRTGTFIAIDILLQLIALEGEIGYMCKQKVLINTS